MLLLLLNVLLRREAELGAKLTTTTSLWPQTVGRGEEEFAERERERR